MTAADSEPPSSEAELLSAITSELADAGQTPDLSDDCAHLSFPTALATTDALIEGQHFDLNWDTPIQVGRQAAIVNLSDLAGSGGQAGWLLWSLMLPPNWSIETVRELTRGFASVANEMGAHIVGGNLALTTGPMVISVTAGGPLAGQRPLTRQGARPGDKVCVSGSLGDHALGYLHPTPETRRLRHTWRAHLDEARELAEHNGVSACMDISDGLLLDASRLAAASNLHIAMESDSIPVSTEYTRLCKTDLTAALLGGEDYVLLFTVAADSDLPAWAVQIGLCRPGSGLSLDGDPIDPAGFDHFGEAR